MKILRTCSLLLRITDSLIPGSVNGSNNGSFTHLELLEATHRALYKFIARHSDELELEIGDPIYVQKEAEDLWYEGNYNIIITIGTLLVNLQVTD